MRSDKSWFIVLALVLLAGGAALLIRPFAAARRPSTREPAEVPAGLERATFAGGCYWCTEAVFQQLKGVQSVVSGFCGGTVENPTYDEVQDRATGHAEAVQITYDPAVISYADLLEVFWQTHDPTTPNRQGNDRGPQYRSAIFYHSDEQKRLAEHYKQKLDASEAFARPIVTEIVPFREFYRADESHQNYYANHPRLPYCQLIIGPKVEKVRKVFADKVK
jgi:peptide-methionine (S)-S-oxide reductase